MTSSLVQIDRAGFHGHGGPEPIGLEYLGATLLRAGFEVSFCGHYELVVSEATTRRCLSLFSAMACEWTHVLTLAQAAKLRGRPTVLGGYHACGDYEHIPPQAFDYVVVGEGERMSVALARALLRGESLQIDGYELRPDAIPRVLHCQRIDNIDALPFPLRSADRLGEYILYDLMWPPTSRQRNTAIVLTSRGCRHKCDFCASSTVWGHGVRFRSVANIVAELHDLASCFGTNTIVIIDQSFGQQRDWTHQVCKAIQDAELGMNWYHQSNLTIERDVVMAMADAGCTKIGFGLEGMSPMVAERVKPIHSHDFGYVNDLFDYCTSLGLFVKAYLMIGFPWETEEIVGEYFEYVSCLRASQIKISYMTPFPGTQYWQEYSGQLITRNWAHFDTVSMPVVKNPRISVEKYHRIRTELFEAFYGSDTFADGVRRMIAAFPHYVQSYREFCEYLWSNGMITGKEPWLSLVGWRPNRGQRDLAGGRQR